jgi:hypothetical protein
MFGNTNQLSNNAHNKYFNYYVYIKFRSWCVSITLPHDTCVMVMIPSQITVVCSSN